MVTFYQVFSENKNGQKCLFYKASSHFAPVILAFHERQNVSNILSLPKSLIMCQRIGKPFREHFP